MSFEEQPSSRNHAHTPLFTANVDYENQVSAMIETSLP